MIVNENQAWMPRFSSTIRMYTRCAAHRILTNARNLILKDATAR
jgi:hypothetical protein